MSETGCLSSEACREWAAAASARVSVAALAAAFSASAAASAALVAAANVLLEGVWPLSDIPRPFLLLLLVAHEPETKILFFAAPVTHFEGCRVRPVTSKSITHLEKLIGDDFPVNCKTLTNKKILDAC